MSSAAFIRREASCLSDGPQLLYHMKYFEVIFHIAPYSGDVADVLCALLADEGFEAFEQSEDTLLAWIQQQRYAQEGLDRAIEAIPFPNITVVYNVSEAPDENWNRRWETDGFKPIIIYDEVEGHDSTFALVTIHDCMHCDIPDARYDICISPCQAFGTGSHETTRMIIRQLLSMPMKGRYVIDAGTGTGILAILCHMLEAEEVVAYDIDDWSVRNAQENLLQNGITHGVQVLLGDSSVLSCIYHGHEKPYHQATPMRASLLIANINRNILLGDMPVFAENLDDDGELLLSGFYVTDVPMLLAEANRLGFFLCHQAEDHEWAMLLLKKGKHTAQ